MRRTKKQARESNDNNTVKTFDKEAVMKNLKTILAAVSVVCGLLCWFATAQAAVARSCAKQVTMDVQLTDSYLKSSVDNSASFVNINQVKLYISGSFISAEYVKCAYKSQNGDIPNIVYKFPCKGAKKGATSYVDSYWCQQ
jgi:cell division protein FtsB